MNENVLGTYFRLYLISFKNEMNVKAKIILMEIMMSLSMVGIMAILVVEFSRGDTK